MQKLCNNYKKPAGVTGEIDDRINRCIEIDRRIQQSTNLGMLGASSGEDSSLKSSSSATYDEASVREDSQGIDNWMEVDDGVDEDFSPPPINLNNEVNNDGNPEETPTVATQNDGIHNVQPPHVSAVNNNAVDCTTTTSTTTPHRKSTSGSKNRLS